MKNVFRFISLGLILSVASWCQTTSENGPQTTTSQTKKIKTKKQRPGAGRDVANGTGDIAGGAGKAAGSVAKGGAKTAGDLVTLHPINAGVDAGKGVAGAGKDVGVGTVKGTGKVFRGIGKGIKHIF